jgi:hypothetical protein
MTITRDRVLALRPRRPFLDWYEGNEETDALKLLLQVNDVSPSWATWGFTHAINKNQCVRIAIYCAELVINIYEECEGATDAPRKAIAAAKSWLYSPSPDAARSSRDAAFVASDALAAAYAADAVYAAYAASDISDAVRVKKETQEKIIREAVRILEEGE